MRLRSLILLACAAAATRMESRAEGPVISYQGAGWVQLGRIEKSSDTISNADDNNFNKNWNQNTGGQITVVARKSDRWEGSLGLGVIQAHNARGSLNATHLWGPYWAPYVTEARITRSGSFGEHKMSLTLGSFPYDYNPDVKNLGLYLLRGLVYPGIVISGFETKHVLPIASIFGGLFRYEYRGLRNDLILNSETENKPYFDFSLADVASYKIAPGLEVGAGVNFYRFLPQNSKVTSPDKSCKDEPHSYFHDAADPEACFSIDTVSFDSASNTAVLDTITGSMAGTKVMGRFRLDPKQWFGWGQPFGAEDLVIYGEAAILGLKDQGKYYNDITRRIPVMLGLNLPAFGFLDNLSLEVEYYGSRNYSDYGKSESYASWLPRVVFDQNGKALENVRDDWKWSLYGSRVIMGHLKLSAQVADDHLRTGGVLATGKATWAEALSTPADWYWMCKLAYFF